VLRRLISNWMVYVSLALGLVGCAEFTPDTSRSFFDRPPNGPRDAWKDVKSWMRQDSECDLGELERTRFDLLVVSSRCTGNELEADELKRLKRAHWVLVYLDIARATEAEPRVWPRMVNPRSAFVERTPTVWGAYPADVTSEAWFRVLEVLIRDDLERGYDGFWLDDCAGFWELRRVNEKSVIEHTNLVRRIRRLVDSIRPGVKLICNSDTTLIELDIGRSGDINDLRNTPFSAGQAGRTGFLAALDGVTIEGFTFNMTGPGRFNQENDDVRRSKQEKWFTAVRARGEMVFTLDYAIGSSRQRTAWQEARRFGFVPAINQGRTVGAFMQ
jgi:endo-alpha-1,4-polygalactosaminidase (GH114 family)